MGDSHSMRYTVKSIDRRIWNVEVMDPEATVRDLKEQLESLSVGPATAMQLVYAGAVLKDEALLSALNIKPNDFLVVSVARSKRRTPATTADAQNADAEAGNSQKTAA